MRFVDFSRLVRPEDWDELATRALEEVSTVAPEERVRTIEKHREVWAQLKPALESLSRKKKCWYCEAVQERSDKQVDHFRPKGRVSKEDCEDHPGYWWLAFDWTNMRYSCTYCNARRKDIKSGTAGGKADRFPLRDESQRCYAPEGAIGNEQPVLLDPTVAADPGLLWFDEDGSATPAAPGDEDSWPYVRARKSIEIYHLNHEDLREARQAVCNQCKQLATAADGAWEDYRAGEPAGERRFKEAIGTLMLLLSMDAEYSATARATIMGLRGESRPWLDPLVAAA